MTDLLELNLQSLFEGFDHQCLTMEEYLTNPFLDIVHRVSRREVDNDEEKEMHFNERTRSVMDDVKRSILQDENG